MLMIFLICWYNMAYAKIYVWLCTRLASVRNFIVRFEKLLTKINRSHNCMCHCSVCVCVCAWMMRADHLKWNMMKIDTEIDIWSRDKSHVRHTLSSSLSVELTVFFSSPIIEASWACSEKSNLFFDSLHSEF